MANNVIDKIMGMFKGMEKDQATLTATQGGQKIDLFNPVSAMPDKSKVKIKEFVNNLDASDNLNDFLVQYGISRENQPHAYQTIVDMWKQSGEPSINTSPAKGLLMKVVESIGGGKVRGSYSPFFNEIKTYGDKDLDILIDELAHPYEEKESGALGWVKNAGRAAYDFLYDIATDDDRYSREGAMEHGVHEITGPQLQKDITNALKIDFENALGYPLEEYLGNLNSLDNWGAQDTDQLLKYMNNKIWYQKRNKP